MYDINYSFIKKRARTFYIFLIFGIIFLVIIAAIYVSGIKKANRLDATTTSKLVKVEERLETDSDGYEQIMYSPTYYYEVDGENYECKSNSSSSINPGTDNKTVYYNSKDPKECMTEYSKSSNKILLLVMLLPILFIVIGLYNIISVIRRINVIKELNKTGKLVKGLPYNMVSTGTRINNREVYRPVIDYVLPSGEKVVLKGDPRYDFVEGSQSGTCDLLIDEMNPKNYFIDYEIVPMGQRNPM